VTTVAPTREPAPTPTIASIATQAVTPTTAQLDVLPGEPWLVFGASDLLYLVRPDGTDSHPLELGDLRVEGVPFAPSWAPDGERIVFVMRTDMTGSIWTAAADGSNPQLLYDPEDCTQSFWPVLSPDAKSLAMACYVDNDGDTISYLSVLDLASMKRSDIATFDYPETFDNPPSWSPDGRMLTFEVINWDPSGQFVESSVIATVESAGGEVRRLTDPELMGGHPDWSPDGSLIAFNTYDTGNVHEITQASNVYTVDPDGTGLTQLSTASVNGTMRLGQPFWSMDGSGIWVSVAREYEQYKNTLGWVDASTGDFTEIGTEGKRFRERPIPH
jgi:Tol biopolymer transport system component